ncbi:MAG: hypothetical protein ACYTBJ_01075 [Planctomycetota bacterium]|jgi:hypothetical protein
MNKVQRQFRQFIQIDNLSYMVRFPDDNRGAYVCDEWVKYGTWTEDVLFLEDGTAATVDGRIYDLRKPG